MNKFLTLLISFIIGASAFTNVKAASIQSEPPVVHAILFWSNGCPFCTQVLTQTLPKLQAKYETRLSILLIELVSVNDINNLYDLGASLGFSQDQVAVPFLIVDHTALIGANEIQSKLSGLIDTYLSAGGVEYPEIPQMGEMLKNGIVFTSFDLNQVLAPATSASTNASGVALAWSVMILMGLAIALVIVAIARAFQGKAQKDLQLWMDMVIPILSIIGLGVSIYLTYVEVSHTRALCGPVGDCNAVQNSPYARLFGILPIGLVGAIGYIAILITWLWRRYRSDSLARIAGLVMFGMALFGTLFSVYLTYLELFVIHAVCIWCLSSAVIITILMLLSQPPITQWLAISDEEDEIVA